MSKILVIDDDKSRQQKIADKLIESLEICATQIDFANCMESAKTQLKKIFYSAVFLDLSLPQEGDGRKIHDAGFRLLRLISANRLIKPARIIGMTALDDNIKNLEVEFDALGFRLFYSPPGDYSWLPGAIKQAEYSLHRRTR